MGCQISCDTGTMYSHNLLRARLPNSLQRVPTTSIESRVSSWLTAHQHIRAWFWSDNHTPALFLSTTKGIIWLAQRACRTQQWITGHTDGKIHVYTDMHVGHIPDVVLRLSCTRGEDSWECQYSRDIRPQTLCMAITMEQLCYSSIGHSSGHMQQGMGVDTRIRTYKHGEQTDEPLSNFIRSERTMSIVSANFMLSMLCMRSCHLHYRWRCGEVLWPVTPSIRHALSAEVWRRLCGPRVPNVP